MTISAINPHFATHFLHKAVNQYALAIQAIKKSDMDGFLGIIISAGFSKLQLSELLIHATASSNPQIAIILIRKGADVEYDNQRALTLAKLSNNTTVANYIMEHQKNIKLCFNNEQIVN